MTTTTISPVDYGFINLLSGVYGSGEGLILASVTSSQNSNENRAYWYYDTSAAALAAASPSIPSDAIIDAVTWHSYLDSISYGVIDEYNRSFNFSGSNSGALGGTLDAGDFGTALSFITGFASMSVGTQNIDVSALGINRSGYTNYSWACQIQEGGSPGGWQLNSSWSPGTLDITWHVASTAKPKQLSLARHLINFGKGPSNPLVGL